MSIAFVRQTARPLSVAVLLSVLCGCASQLPQHSADISLPAQWRHTLGATPHAPPATALPSASWWQLFGNDEIDRLVAQVAASNLQAREMATRVAAAEVLEPTAASAFRPALRAFSTPAQTPDSRGSYLQAGLEASWPLGLFRRASAQKAAARAQTRLARADADALHTRIVAETVRSYLEWHEARVAIENLDARITSQAERVELMNTRVRLHLSALHDSAEEQSRLDELKSQRLATDRKMTEQTERLGLLTATTEAYPASAQPQELEPFALPSMRSVPADLLRGRADVRLAEELALQAAAQLNVAQADLYPQLTLVGSLTVSFPMAGESGAARSLAAIAPAIDIPLFDWGRRRALATARDRSLEGALIAYREAILTAVHEVETALATLASLEKDSELHRARLVRAELAETTSTQAISLGRASRFDALEATLARLEAQAALETAEHARALAWVGLCEALGGTNPAAAT